MKILITGGAGFVGSHIIAKELDMGNEVICIDIHPTNIGQFIDSPHFTFHQDSILNEKFMEKNIRKCDMVIHMAAIANPDIYCINPNSVLQTNLEGTILISKLCLKYGKKIVFSSSSEVYGKNSMVPWNEEALSVICPNNMRWCYSISKVAGEFYLRSLEKEGLVFAIGRFFNFYGPNLEGRVISMLLNKFINNEPALVVFPGDQTRCFTYITDAIDGFLSVAHDKRAEGEIFNIGVETETSIWSLAEMIKRIGNFQSPIKIVSPDVIYEDGYDDIPRRAPDTDKIQKHLGWYPKIGLEDGLKKTIRAYKRNYHSTHKN